MLFSKCLANKVLSPFIGSEKFTLERLNCCSTSIFRFDVNIGKITYWSGGNIFFVDTERCVTNKASKLFIVDTPELDIPFELAFFLIDFDELLVVDVCIVPPSLFER